MDRIEPVHPVQRKQELFEGNTLRNAKWSDTWAMGYFVDVTRLVSVRSIVVYIANILASLAEGCFFILVFSSTFSFLFFPFLSFPFFDHLDVGGSILQGVNHY